MATFHLRDNFKSGPVSQVPASWFNSVARFINNLIGGEGVTVDKHDDGAPSVISVDASSSFSAEVSVLTGASWNGTQLVFTVATLTIANGVVTSKTDGDSIVINTVTYNP